MAAEEGDIARRFEKLGTRNREVTRLITQLYEEVCGSVALIRELEQLVPYEVRKRGEAGISVAAYERHLAGEIWRISAPEFLGNHGQGYKSPITLPGALKPIVTGVTLKAGETFKSICPTLDGIYKNYERSCNAILKAHQGRGVDPQVEWARANPMPARPGPAHGSAWPPGNPNHRASDPSPAPTPTPERITQMVDDPEPNAALTDAELAELMGTDDAPKPRKRQPWEIDDTHIIVSGQVIEASSLTMTDAEREERDRLPDGPKLTEAEAMAQAQEHSRAFREGQEARQRRVREESGS